MDRLTNISTTITKDYVSILVTKWNGDRVSGSSYDAVWLLNTQLLCLTTLEKTLSAETLMWHIIKPLYKEISGVLSADLAIQMIKSWLEEKKITLEHRNILEE